jgi:hypothetical protein
VRCGERAAAGWLDQPIGDAALNDRTVRNLAHLEESASTARVLNLLRVYRRQRNNPAYNDNPLFQSPTLNRSIILKHRLRRNERDLFFDARKTATKIIIPIDGAELKLGGRFVFVNQINYDSMMADFLGDIWSTNRADHDLLAIIDGLPSLDPFLLREQLRRHGRDPARCYFEISDADMSRMFGFVEGEVQKLINLCYEDGKAPVKTEAEERRGSRLVQKILSATVDAETEPLRLTLRLEKREYQEGVFCWKGFLYYKWTLSEALPDVTRVADAIATIRPRGGSDSETLANIDKTRNSLRGAILSALEAARKSLRYYDAAFDGLIGGRPTAFREFLLSAPAMFCDLGERLGAVNHIVSFWNFRFPQGKLPTVTGPELIDILVDFEESLAFNENSAAAQRLAS